MKIEFEINIKDYPELQYLADKPEIFKKIIHTWLAYIFEVDKEDITSLKIT